MLELRHFSGENSTEKRIQSSSKQVATSGWETGCYSFHEMRNSDSPNDDILTINNWDFTSNFTEKRGFVSFQRF